MNFTSLHIFKFDVWAQTRLTKCYLLGTQIFDVSLSFLEFSLCVYCDWISFCFAFFLNFYSLYVSPPIHVYRYIYILFLLGISAPVLCCCYIFLFFFLRFVCLFFFSLVELLKLHNLCFICIFWTLHIYCTVVQLSYTSIIISFDSVCVVNQRLF